MVFDFAGLSTITRFIYLIENLLLPKLIILFSSSIFIIHEIISGASFLVARIISSRPSEFFPIILIISSSNLLVGIKASWRTVLSILYSVNMAEESVTTFAPLAISWFGPFDFEEKIEPGTAKTSRFWSKAHLAVISDPLLSSASTTSTPLDSPLMILFL